MNKKVFLIVLLLGLIVSGIGYTMQTSTASNLDGSENLVIPVDDSRAAKEAEAVMEKAIKAMRENDERGMIENTHDVRYQKQSDRQKNLESISNGIKDIQIDDVRSVNNTLVMVTITQTDTDDGVSIVTLPVYKMKGEWKVITGGTSHRPYKYDSN